MLIICLFNFYFYSTQAMVVIIDELFVKSRRIVGGMPSPNGMVRLGQAIPTPDAIIGQGNGCRKVNEEWRKDLMDIPAVLFANDDNANPAVPVPDSPSVSVILIPFSPVPNDESITPFFIKCLKRRMKKYWLLKERKCVME